MEGLSIYNIVIIRDPLQSPCLSLTSTDYVAGLIYICDQACITWHMQPTFTDFGSITETHFLKEKLLNKYATSAYKSACL